MYLNFKDLTIWVAVHVCKFNGISDAGEILVASYECESVIIIILTEKDIVQWQFGWKLRV